MKQFSERSKRRESAAAASLRSDSIWYVCTGAVYRISSKYCREESTLTDQPRVDRWLKLSAGSLFRVGSVLSNRNGLDFLGNGFPTCAFRIKIVSFLQAARTGRRDEIVVEVEQGIFLHM